MMNSAQSTHLSVIESKREHSQLLTYYDKKYRLVWGYMHAHPRPCFTNILLGELKDWFTELSVQNEKDIQYAVLASDIPGIYNLGGDLNLFRELIMKQDKPGLLRYAKSCIDALYFKMKNFHRDITHITLVQGDALGGGFECALASDVLIAERNTKLGLPEVLFNLFPGMGAYSLLSRKLDPACAQKMILSGKLYSAEELYEIGVVDVLADEQQGEMAVYDYIRREDKHANSYQALRRVKDCVNPVTHEELMSITEIWVETALRLESRDLRMMERLVTKQSKRQRENKGLRSVELK